MNTVKVLCVNKSSIKLINDKLIIMKMNRCILFLFPIKNHKNCFDQIEFLLFSIIIICGCFDTHNFMKSTHFILLHS